MLSLDQLEQIKATILCKAQAQGFQDARVSDINVDEYFTPFQQWVKNDYHGEMSFLERNQNLRQFPDQLHPGTLRVISLRYNYLPEQAKFAETLKQSQNANISRYALGRDYHKLLRKKLSNLCQQLEKEFSDLEELDYRVFVDSAPVLETAFAEKSGLGWKGKHSLVINQSAGSWFFLAEIFINLPLPVDPPVEDLCGSCSACIKLCPTNAILDSKTVDATRCISYLTIENKGEIPTELRPLLGNHIYGCDDCQLACPWNRFSELSKDTSFAARHHIDDISLITLWQWNEEEFLTRFQGSPIRRIGYQSWLRNIAVALGNGSPSEEVINQLKDKRSQVSPIVQEHIDWALEQLEVKEQQSAPSSSKRQKLINCIVSMLPRDA